MFEWQIPILLKLKIAEAPDHSVLPNAKLYDLRNLVFSWGYEEGLEGFLTLEMSTHVEYVRLLFSGVKDICIPSGNSISSVCIRILDLHEFLPDVPARIFVQHPKGGGLTFWADDVVRFDP